MALKGDFKTRPSTFVQGYGLVIKLDKELPRKYDEAIMGANDTSGYVMNGHVINVLGAKSDHSVAPAINDVISVTVRPDDPRSKIFSDLNQTQEASLFLLEGVSGELDNLTARWAHGAGDNRDIQALEIVGVPSVRFDNPEKDGPRTLRLNLDGSPTVINVKLPNDDWVEQELTFSDVVERLKATMATGGKFRVSQRVVEPSGALVVNNQEQLENVLTSFRDAGYTNTIVRIFIAGTNDPRNVEMQYLSWPHDIPASESQPARIYEMPALSETKRYVALRDGEAEAIMEVIPGYELSLIGNPSDPTKSAKHAFVNNIIGKGLSESQMKLFKSQSYGPGISIRAKDGDNVLGLIRTAIRTEGTQIRGLMQIPTAAFPEASTLDFSAKAESFEPNDDRESDTPI